MNSIVKVSILIILSAYVYALPTSDPAANKGGGGGYGNGKTPVLNNPTPVESFPARLQVVAVPDAKHVHPTAEEEASHRWTPASLPPMTANGKLAPGPRSVDMDTASSLVIGLGTYGYPGVPYYAPGYYNYYGYPAGVYVG